ncbi:unnamed protein product [Prorocentrum cordatum]|uniref:Uncharacterized protein n=1 Tax=Prorocentrum cordatum TaxID=2364126 RepID=A0ABN9TBH2_9DINO|nr:unnamed protein product [Polarella glacialis]
MARCSTSSSVASQSGELLLSAILGPSRSPASDPPGMSSELAVQATPWLARALISDHPPGTEAENGLSFGIRPARRDSRMMSSATSSTCTPPTISVITRAVPA